MKAKDVLKRLVVLCDKGALSNANMDKVFNGMSIISNGEVIGKYRNGMLVTLKGAVKSLSVDKIDAVSWPDVDIKKQ